MNQRDEAICGNSSGGGAGNQGPSFFDKFAACTEADRSDNALRGLGQACGHPDLGNAGANLTNTATGAGGWDTEYFFWIIWLDRGRVTVTGQIGTYPYGESWYTASGEKLVFTTYERDAESDGNDYAMARTYSSRLGRFTAVDPLSGDISNPQSLNRYVYALDDPINGADPTGMDDNATYPLCLDAVECGGWGWLDASSAGRSRSASSSPQIQKGRDRAGWSRPIQIAILDSAYLPFFLVSFFAGFFIAILLLELGRGQEHGTRASGSACPPDPFYTGSAHPCQAKSRLRAFIFVEARSVRNRSVAARGRFLREGQLPGAPRGS